MPLPVYIVHYQAPDWLRDAIASIQRSSVPVTVTVIDNGGAPDNLDVRVIRQDRNRGYTGGANAALRDWPRAEPWAIIGSHDLIVEPETFEWMLDDARAKDGIIGPTGDVQTSGTANLANVEWLPGSCLMIRRECFEAVGFFDEHFGSYGEDADYGLRARDAGWNLRLSAARAYGRGARVGTQRALRARRGRAVYLGWKRDGTVGLQRSVKLVVYNAFSAAKNRRWHEAGANALGVIDGLVLCVRSPRRRPF
jgi:GT2 family glycosyltransferase